MSCVFLNTPHLLLPFFMALHPIQKNMMHSVIYHECGWHSKTHLWVQRVSQSNFNSSHFSFLLKVLHLQLFPRHLVYPLHPVKPLHPAKPLIVARLLVPNIHGDQLEEHLVCLFLHSYIVYFLTLFFKIRSPKLFKRVIATNFLRCRVLTLRIQFLPGALRFRPSTNHLPILSKLLRPRSTMVIMHFLIPVFSFTKLLLGNISSHGSEFAMLGSCAWQKSHLLPCRISLGAQFWERATLYQGERIPRQRVVVKKLWI